MVARYGSMFTNWDGTPWPWSRSARAYAPPKNRLAPRTPMGWARPNMTATSAMKPRPKVMPSTNWVTMPSDSWAPARPHNAPLREHGRVLDAPDPDADAAGRHGVLADRPQTQSESMVEQDHLEHHHHAHGDPDQGGLAA